MTASGMGQFYVVIRCESVFDRIHKVEGVETCIGRNDQCTIWLPDLLVSRKHAIIIQAEATFLIRDLGSRNGTHLNGCQIQRDEVLTEGTELQIRPYRLTVFCSLTNAIRAKVSTDDSTRSGVATDEDYEQHLSRLTPAQRRVYDLFLEGLIEKEVGTRLGIKPNTVHDHAKAIYKALSVSTRGELISRGIQRYSPNCEES